MRFGWARGLVVSLTVFLTACQQAITPGVATVASSAASERVRAEYRLGAGDKLRITTYGEDSLTGEFTISTVGTLAFPLIGEVEVGGKSTPEVQKEIEDRLADGFLKQPRVGVEVLNYRPFYILGEVNKSGQYPYSSGLTVLNAIATAEGFAYRANKSSVFIRRAGSQSENEYPLTTTLPVEPGDTIRIKERFM